jgi:lactate dehydrogenase-like 2-hydroxyacid dehydrogenase
MTAVLLVLVHVPADARGLLEAACRHHGLAFLEAADPDARASALAADGGRVRAVLTNGATGLTAAEIDAMPALTLVAALGAGHENVASAHARQRGIEVVNGAGTNDDAVADHALGLLLASVRGLRQQDIACRAGRWRDDLPLYGQLAGSRVGILGLGTIGRKIAHRVAAFDAEVGYHNRRPRTDLPWRHFDAPVALAAWCDHLVVAAPGGPATRHLVGADVLAALRPHGCLVNIARGSVVDTAALADALAAGRLGGAGLDVYESEPAPPAALLGFPNVLLSPHVAGWSPEAIQASFRRFADNLARHLAGEPVLSPI